MAKTGPGVVTSGKDTDCPLFWMQMRVVHKEVNLFASKRKERNSHRVLLTQETNIIVKT